MATIGQVLTMPEAGWKRINNTDLLISYVGNGWQFIKDTYLSYVATDSIHFKFNGSKIRVIGAYDFTWAATKVNITIDGVSYIYDQSVGGTAIGKLLFEKSDLQDSEHSVVITGTVSVDASHYFSLCAIDIDGAVVLSAPTDLTATSGDSQVTLSWTAVSGATSYNVKRSTTAGGPYTTIATNVNGTSYIDNAVTNGTTYYYVVTAVDNPNNESANSNEASATPVAVQVPNGQALLLVTMIDSSEREYQLSTAEIDGFINWYTRTIGTGTTCYVLNKKVGLQNSKEYLAFDKIISFEVMELTK